MTFNEYLIGKRERLSWVDETSYGTGGDMASDGEVIGLNATIEPDLNQNWQEILQAGADSRAIENMELGPLSLPFTLTFTPVNWKFLKYLCYSVADAGSDPYTHTFTLANTIQSFKLEWALRHTTPVVITLTGGFVTSGTINFSKGTGSGEAYITVSLNCFAQDVDIGSSVTTLSSITRTGYQFRHIKAIIDNEEVVEVNNGEITIDLGINTDDSRYCNATLNRKVGEPIPTIQRLNGRLNVNLKNSDFMDDWDTGDTISNCSLDFIQNNSNNKLEMDFSSLRLSNAFPSTNPEGVTNADLDFSLESFSSMIATDNISTY